jgi:glycosyltransferase involved in cell wall biosynthesis
VGDRTARLIESSSGLPSGSIATLYHGMRDVGREPVDRPSGPTLLTVARHDPVKGLDVLLSAMALVPESVRLVVIGDGSETGNLRAQARALALGDRVEFRSLPWEVRAADLMWSFDGLVLPSRVEGFPVTIVEAMLAGLPVVATDVGSVDEAVVPGETGWIVPSEDSAALAAAITELTSDLPAAQLMGRRAREIALGRFTIDATVDAYVALYRAVLGPSGWGGRQI